MRVLRGGVVLAVMLLVMTLCFAGAGSAQQTVISKFDHAQTGFPLTGEHLITDCESCHVNGRFRGTPTACVACHNGTQATGKSASHAPTSSSCEGCHSTGNWKVVRYDHSLALGPCIGCHNGSHATGQPTNHIQTTAPCDTCHKSTVTFYAANFDHSGVTGNCASCHNGSKAVGKPSNHIATSAPCETCHTGFTVWSSATFSHVGITQPCATCHN
ncbi:MAG: hypothetical protein WBV61_00890, partial [Rhodanobacteraceae bacterium]